MASASLSRSISSSPTNPDKFTVSMWVKRTGQGAEQVLLGNYSSSNFRGKLQFKSNDKIEYYQVNDGNATAQVRTTRVFRDPNAWYHLVVQFDTSQGTASDRIKIYINGTQETSFDISSYPAQNLDMRPNQPSTTLHIGQDGNSGNYLDAELAHVHLADGQTYAPTVFAETDATTGIWKPIVAPSVTYGDDGFFLKFDNSANMGLDTSGQSNNFTTNGTIIQTKDTPDNVFATFNPLDWANRNITLTNANGTATNTDTAIWEAKYAMSTLSMSAGKYYAEFKVGNIGTNQLYVAGIIAEPESQNINSSIGSFGLGLYSPGKIFNLGSEAQTSLGAIVADDIIGVAFDVTNGTLQFYKNGSTIGSQITSIATAGKLWRFGVNGYDGSWVMHANFGNGYFGTTAVSSAQNPDDGVGIFEYSVPSGYKALCTKSINAQEYS